MKTPGRNNFPVWPALALLFLLGVTLLSACAPEDESGSSSTGGIAVGVIWPSATQPSTLSIPNPIRAAAPAGVFSLVATVSGPAMADVSGGTDTTPGESGTFNVDNVPVGAERSLTLQGFSEAGGAGEVLYEGAQTGITVSVGANEPATVTMEVVPGSAADTGSGTQGNAPPTAFDISDATTNEDISVGITLIATDNDGTVISGSSAEFVGENGVCDPFKCYIHR